jgi:hypothetical protein
VARACRVVTVLCLLTLGCAGAEPPAADAAGVRVARQFAAALNAGDVRRAEQLLASNANIPGGSYLAEYARQSKLGNYRTVGRATTLEGRVDLPYRADTSDAVERGVFHVWVVREDGDWRVYDFDAEPSSVTFKG